MRYPPRLLMAGTAAIVSAALTPGIGMAQIAAPFGPQGDDAAPLQLATSFESIYDDNILRTDRDTSPVISDLILRPGATADYARQDGDNRFHVAANAAYGYYVGNPDRSRLTTAALVDPVLRRGLIEAAPVVKIDVSDVDYGDINSQLKNRRTFASVGGTLRVARDAGFYPLAGVTVDVTRNNAAFRFANQRSTTTTVGIGYVRPSLGRASLYYSRIAIDRPTIDIRTDVDRFGLTFQRAVVSRVAMNVDIHALKVRSAGARIGNYQGPGWDADLTIRPGGRVLYTIGTARRIVNDSLIPSGYAISSEYRLTARWQVQERFELDGAGYIVSRDFRQDPLVISSPIGADRYTVVSGGARRTLVRGLKLVGKVDHIHRTTNSGINDFDATTINLGVSVGL